MRTFTLSGKKVYTMNLKDFDCLEDYYEAKDKEWKRTHLKSGFPRGLKLTAGTTVEISDTFDFYIEPDGRIKCGVKYDGHGGAVPVHPYKACRSGGWDLCYDLNINNVKRRWDKISWF